MLRGWLRLPLLVS